MNAFVISVGGYITQLREKAIETAESNGKVFVDYGRDFLPGTRCCLLYCKMIERISGSQTKKTVRC